MIFVVVLTVRIVIGHVPVIETIGQHEVDLCLIPIKCLFLFHRFRNDTDGRLRAMDISILVDGCDRERLVSWFDRIFHRNGLRIQCTIDVQLSRSTERSCIDVEFTKRHALR